MDIKERIKQEMIRLSQNRLKEHALRINQNTPSYHGCLAVARETYGHRSSKKSTIALNWKAFDKGICRQRGREGKFEEPLISLENWIAEIIKQPTQSQLVFKNPPQTFDLLNDEITYTRISLIDYCWQRKVTFLPTPKFVVFPHMREYVAAKLSIPMDATFHVLFNQIAQELLTAV